MQDIVNMKRVQGVAFYANPYASYFDDKMYSLKHGI